MMFKKLPAKFAVFLLPLIISFGLVFSYSQVYAQDADPSPSPDPSPIESPSPSPSDTPTPSASASPEASSSPSAEVKSQVLGTSTSTLGATGTSLDFLKLSIALLIGIFAFIAGIKVLRGKTEEE